MDPDLNNLLQQNERFQLLSPYLEHSKLDDFNLISQSEFVGVFEPKLRLIALLFWKQMIEPKIFEVDNNNIDNNTKEHQHNVKYSHHQIVQYRKRLVPELVQPLAFSKYITIADARRMTQTLDKEFIKIVDCSVNDISDDCAEELANFLLNFQAAEYIDISFCRFTAESWPQLKNVLQIPNLKYLHVVGMISFAGIECIEVLKSFHHLEWSRLVWLLPNQQSNTTWRMLEQNGIDSQTVALIQDTHQKFYQTFILSLPKTVRPAFLWTNKYQPL